MTDHIDETENSTSEADVHNGGGHQMPTPETGGVPQPHPTEGVNPTDTPDDTDHNNPGREAAKYRRQLRDTEAERDQLRAQVETMQKAAIEAAADLPAPAALWAAGHTVTDLLDDNGQPDPDKINAATRSTRESLGIRETRPGPRPDLTQGGHGSINRRDQWQDAFAPAQN